MLLIHIWHLTMLTEILDSDPSANICSPSHLALNVLPNLKSKIRGQAILGHRQGKYSPQLSQKITGIKKICKTWDLYQSILYTLEDYFLKKSKFFNTGFFFYRPISSFTL